MGSNKMRFGAVVVAVAIAGTSAVAVALRDATNEGGFGPGSIFTDALPARIDDVGPVGEISGPQRPQETLEHPHSTVPVPSGVEEAKQRASEIVGPFASSWEVVGCGTVTAGALAGAQRSAEKPVPSTIATAPANLRLYVCAVDLKSEGVAAVIFPAELAPHDISSVWGAEDWDVLDYIPNLPIA